MNCGPQRFVAGQDATPRVFERVEIKAAPQTTHELLNVVSRFGVGESVEEHPLLHRRERIKVFDVVRRLRSGMNGGYVHSLGSQLKRSNGASRR